MVKCALVGGHHARVGGINRPDTVIAAGAKFAILLWVSAGAEHARSGADGNFDFKLSTCTASKDARCAGQAIDHRARATGNHNHHGRISIDGGAARITGIISISNVIAQSMIAEWIVTHWPLIATGTVG